MECENRWVELHPFVFDEIVRRVDSSGDYARLRAVCKSWSLDMPKNPVHIKNPWLVLPFDDEEETLRPFYNIAEGKIYRFELPETRKTMFRGSYYGWLVAIGIDDTLQILNPFTRENFDLPPLSTFPDIKSYEPDRLEEEYTILCDDGEEFTVDKGWMQKCYVTNIIISSRPNHDDTECMAAAIYGQNRRLAYYKIGDKRWTDIPTPESLCMYQDVIFHERKLYAIKWNAQLYEYDMKTVSGGIGGVEPPLNLNLGNIFLNPKYLVATLEGPLMIVRRLKLKFLTCNGEKISKGDITSEFEIYKLQLGEWSSVNNLNNFVILLGHNFSVYISSDTFPDSKGNGIYFTDDNVDYLHDNNYGGQDIGYYDLEDGSFNRLFPNIDYIKPYPIWVLHRIP